MSQSYFENYVSNMTQEERIAYEHETAILEATELVFRLMEEQNINQKELAEKLNKSKSNISQILNGNRNMTFHTFCSMLYHLDQRFLPKSEPLDQEVGMKQSDPTDGAVELPTWDWAVDPRVIQPPTVFQDYDPFAGCSSELKTSEEPLSAISYGYVD